MIAGKWTYRSYHNDTALIGDDAAAALALIFGEGVFDLAQNDDTHFHGALGMGTGYALTLTGTIDDHGGGMTPEFAIVGLGVPGTATEGWRYDYRCALAYAWPEAVDQIPCLVGTVVRVNPHGPGASAGVTASFVAVRQPDTPEPRTLRTNKLTLGL